MLVKSEWIQFPNLRFLQTVALEIAYLENCCSKLCSPNPFLKCIFIQVLLQLLNLLINFKHKSCSNISRYRRTLLSLINFYSKLVHMKRDRSAVLIYKNTVWSLKYSNRPKFRLKVKPTLLIASGKTSNQHRKIKKRFMSSSPHYVLANKNAATHCASLSFQMVFQGSPI